MPWLGALPHAERHVPLPVQAQGFPHAAESLKRLSQPCPQLLRYGSVVPDEAAVKLAEPVCSFLLLASSSYQGHLLPALF